MKNAEETALGFCGLFNCTDVEVWGGRGWSVKLV